MKEPMKPNQDEIFQLTDFDSRFYQYGEEFRPSVTYVIGVGYPTPIQMQKWVSEKGWDQARAIKEAAGEDGSLVHNSIEQLLRGEIVTTEFLSGKAKRGVKAFVDWYTEEQPQIISFEYKVWGTRFAGTVDLLCRIKSDGYAKVWLIDYKSGGVFDTGKMQCMAYKKLDERAQRVAILQLGNTTKKGYTFSEIKEKDEQKYLDLFEASYRMYQLLKPNDKPRPPYPLTFKLPNPIQHESTNQ